MKDNGNEELREFAVALKRLPPPISCYANGACCPWCGWVHSTIRFGMNACEECGKEFAFGYPEGWGGKDPASWVPFPFREFDALGRRANLLPEWKPNDRLKAIYFEKAEEQIGKTAAENGVQ